MLSLRSLILALALMVPTGALADSVNFEVLTGIVPGEWDFSTVHSATGCKTGSYYYCGENSRDMSGKLTGERDGVTFTDIRGEVIIDNVSHKVTGELDFSVGKGERVGSLRVADYGVFNFVNVKHWGPSNSYDDDLVALWGQTVDDKTENPEDGWVTNLGLRVTPDPTPGIPEPGAALVFGLGALIVGCASRTRRA